MISIAELRKLLDYNPATGVFVWKLAQGRAKVGMIAGSISLDGYRKIKLNKRLYGASRLAFAYVYGRWPIGEVDHKNKKRTDNRISNLREATAGQNQQNKTPSKSFKGASQHQNKWQARIGVNGVSIYLGYFSSAAKAHSAYKKAARKYFGEFACVS